MDEVAQRAVLYARVSTEEQARSGLSLDHQLRQMRLYCELHRITVWDHVVDTGASGKSLDRPGMAKVLALAAAGDADCVIVYRIDRLTRSVLDFANLVATFEQTGVALRSVTDQLDTSSPAGRLITHVMVSFAQFEREQIALRVREALGEAKQRGTFLGQPPVGYRVQGGRLVRTARFEVVTLAHQLRADGMTLLAICQELEARGIKTSRGFDSWHPRQVSRLLSSPLQVGSGDFHATT